MRSLKTAPRTRLAALLLLAGWLALAGAAHAEANLQQLGGYDVIVVGGEPEAISAAVASAESGASTLLITEDDRLGGLFVLGELNVLDLRTQPHLYQRGLFLRWWELVGRGLSFDVERAERAFRTLLASAGVDVVTGATRIEPHLLAPGVIGGVRVNGVVLPAAQVIDGTAEMDLAARAGASYSVGFASLGSNARMADTLVFRIRNVDWPALRAAIKARGHSYASIEGSVAWGHFGGYPAAYRPLEPGLRLRGLNLGLQDDGSVLVNALLIHGIDPFDPVSMQQGKARAEREAPRIVAYLARELPGFERAEYAGAAERLYIRETRHLDAICRLGVDDVLDNRVTDLDVAAGGYPIDVQALTPNDSGFVFGTPEIYGVQLCVTVPQGLDGLWVVGKAAGFDPLAAASARVVPFGMALAEAVGVAAATAAQQGLRPYDFATDAAHIAQLRRTLLARGVYLPTPTARAPAGPYRHPYYQEYRLLLSRGLAVGGYANDPGLDEPMSALGFIYLLSNVGQRFHGDNELGRALVARYGEVAGPLTTELVLDVTYRAACALQRCPADVGRSTLEQAGLLPPDLPLGGPLTRGHAYAVAARLAALPNITAELPAPHGNDDAGRAGEPADGKLLHKARPTPPAEGGTNSDSE